MKLRTNLALLSVALSGTLYGSMGLFGTWLLQEGFSVSNMLFWRFSTASLTILLMGLRHLHTMNWQILRATLLNSLLYSASSGLFFVASNTIGTGVGMVIFYIYPIFIFLFLWLFLKQPIARSSWFSLAVVILGFIFLNTNIRVESTGMNSLGFGFAVLSSLAYAAYILLSKKRAQQIDAYLSTFVLCLVSSVYFLILSHAEGSFSWPASTKSWITVFALGLIATSVPILLMLKGLETIGAEKAAILSVLEPVFTVILGFIFLEENLSSMQFVGIVIILGGTVFNQLQPNPRKPIDRLS